MNDNELAELEDQSTWDWDRAESQLPIEGRRTLLAVPFNHSEIEQITRQADKAGVTVIEYVRRCSLRSR